MTATKKNNALSVSAWRRPDKAVCMNRAGARQSKLRRQPDQAGRLASEVSKVEFTSENFDCLAPGAKLESVRSYYNATNDRTAPRRKTYR